MKRHHRPFAKHRVVTTVTFILLLASFSLFVLVAFSLTFIKAIYLLSVTSVVTGQPATSIATELRFGVWGVCATSALNQPTLVTNNGRCFGPQLGYDIPPSITSLVNISPSLVDAVLKGLRVVLVLHPVNAGLSLLSLISSIFLAKHGLAILALILTLITALVSSIVLAVDLALVIVAKNKVPELTNNGFAVQWGNAVWMTLVAVVFTWLATILISARVCYCCGVRRRERQTPIHF